MYTFVMCLVMVVTARAGPPIRDHPPLRKSLFPNVPPTINFLVNKENLDFQLPEEIRRTLVYFQSGHKGKGVFSKIMDQTGFHESNETQKATFFWLWGQIRDMRPLLVDEKRSRFHGIEVLTEKDTLWNSYKTKRATFGDEFLYVPKTFILPQERKQLKKEMVSVGPSGRWISKPFSASGGKGISVTNLISKISKKADLLVSRYVDHPYLIHGRRFSLRLFVLVTCLEPLTIYLYEDGFALFSSMKYSADEKDMKNVFQHLSNGAINKHNEENKQSIIWSLHDLKKHIQSEGIPFVPIWENIKDIMIKSLIAVENDLIKKANKTNASRYSSFSWFGVDIILDSNLKPWLAEFNTVRTDLTIRAEVRRRIKTEQNLNPSLVKDILDLARYQIPNRISKKNQMKVVKSLNLQLPLCFDERQFSLELFEFEKMKQNQSSLILTESILDELTPADTRVLIAAEDELDISNRFKRIFPTKETHTYLKFFDEPRYYNTLLSAWEQRFSDDREAGRDILKSLCRDNFHTLVPIK